MDLTLNPVGERTVSLGEQGLGVERHGEDLRLTRTLREGESGGEVVLESMGGPPRRILPAELDQLTEETAKFWRGWVGQSTYRGRWREMVSRSAITLKLMTYAPTGALVAAPTAGLPELTGGAHEPPLDPLVAVPMAHAPWGLPRRFQLVAAAADPIRSVRRYPVWHGVRSSGSWVSRLSPLLAVPLPGSDGSVTRQTASRASGCERGIIVHLCPDR